MCSLVDGSKESLLYDFRGGFFLKNHALFSKGKYAIQIQLLCEDFETANPLGLRCGIHKLGALHFKKCLSKVEFLSAQYSPGFSISCSRHKNTHSLLDPIVRDINIL